MRHAIAILTCLCANPVVAEVDACVIGRWSPDLDQIAAIQANMTGLPMPVWGDVVAEIGADGASRVTLDKFTMDLTATGLAAQSEVSGWAVWSLSAAAGTYVATMQDMDMTGTMSMVNPDGTLNPLITREVGRDALNTLPQQGQYTCANDQVDLRFVTPEGQAMSITWTRR